MPRFVRVLPPLRILTVFVSFNLHLMLGQKTGGASLSNPYRNIEA